MFKFARRGGRDPSKAASGRFSDPLRLVSSIAFVTAVVMTGFVHTRIPTYPDLERSGAFVPEPAVIQRLALGFDAIVADYYWLKAVQSVGGRERVGPEQGAYLGQLVQLVTSLNPRVDHPYRFAAVWLNGSERDVRFANQLLRRGIEYHPDDWRNRFYLGFNHFYYLNENQRAANILSAAGAIAGAPRHLSRLAARLRAESGGLDVAEGLLQELVRDAVDEASRTGYLAALDEIEVERKARTLDAARIAFQRDHGRDIRTVAELVAAPSPTLSRLPDPEPASLPRALKRGSVWLIDSEQGAIVSSYYGKRYAVHFASDRDARVREWEKARSTSPVGFEGEQG